MKKIAIFLIFMALVVTPLYAASITDSVKPLGHLKYAVTVEDNYVYEKVMKKAESLKLEMKKMNQLYGKVSLGLTPNFNVYTKLGASNNGTIEHDSISANQLLKIKTKTGFLWAFGVTGIKEISDGWKIGGDVQYDSWQTDVEKVTVGGNAATNVSGKIQNRELQITPFITKQFTMQSMNWSFSPYLGMPIDFFWSQTDKHIAFRYNSTNQTDSWAKKGKDYIGIVAGSDLTVSESLALNVEGRFIDETAVTAGATYRF